MTAAEVDWPSLEAWAKDTLADIEQNDKQNARPKALKDEVFTNSIPLPEVDEEEKRP